ncbi:MAG TPA: RNA methyltransferase [Burkholderiales bacterium]|nr:RNA methyltransferase [Burkholderiales bacterium]
MSETPRRISSHDNPRFKALLKLQQSSKERRKAGRSLLDGVHLVRAYVDYAGTPEEIVVSELALEDAEVAALLARTGVAPLVLAHGLFRELSSVATPTGIIAVVETPRPLGVPAFPGPCVMLEDIQDPGNLGSILRSAAAAGVGEVYLSRSSVQAWSPRALRAGMGAHFALRISEGVDLKALVEDYPGTVLATVRDAATSVYQADLRGRVALLFGNEGAGLSAELVRAAHERVSIPMPGQAESLNVAAAAAVCLFERVRQLAPPAKVERRAYRGA